MKTGEPIPLERPVTWVAMVGFMGTGKSRIGWELSRALALHFVDTDKVIERVSGMPISQIFELFGESTFREYEEEVVRRVTRLDQVVVSCGGGTFVNPNNRARLLARGPVIALHASAETIFKRTRRFPRVLLQVPDPIGRIVELLEARRPAYGEAHIHVSTDGRHSKDVVEEIVQRLQDWSAGEEGWYEAG
ncbi:MAG TPA: shikimate kinase [Deinococcales bacterium]|nr:shikimate kinase [Deinococcales bacterium]